MDLIDILRKRRLERRVSQYQLAKDAGVVPRRISQWECRRITPHVKMLRAWANALEYELTLTEMQT